jgi:hypothetical protein
MSVFTNIINRCEKYRKNIPDLKPYISNLSSYSSPFNNNSIKIYIYGNNFLAKGFTMVDFGNIKNIPVQYINSNTLYLELYNFLFPGVYDVVVKNTLPIYAKNTTAASIGDVYLQSNIINYTVTN